MTIGYTSTLVLAFALVACRPTSNEWATSEPMLTSSSLVPIDDAIDRIAGAACRREIACGHVGDKRNYADAKECIESQRTSTRNTVTAWGCPSGVIERSLERCVERLRTEACAVRVSAPAQLEECRRMQLCGSSSS